MTEPDFTAVILKSPAGFASCVWSSQDALYRCRLVLGNEEAGSFVAVDLEDAKARFCAIAARHGA